jgi:hypothetical protein
MFILGLVDVRVAHATEQHFDLDIVRAAFFALERAGLQLGEGMPGAIAFYCNHVVLRYSWSYITLGEKNPPERELF